MVKKTLTLCDCFDHDASAGAARAGPDWSRGPIAGAPWQPRDPRDRALCCRDDPLALLVSPTSISRGSDYSTVRAVMQDPVFLVFGDATASGAALAFLMSRPYSLRTLGGHADVDFLKQISSRIGIGGALSRRANGPCPGRPVTYWIPGWPIGFGGNLTGGQSSNTYGNFPSFDGSDARGGGFSYTRYNFPNGWFVGSEGGGMGLSMNGINQDAAFGDSARFPTRACSSATTSRTRAAPHGLCRFRHLEI